MATKQPLRLTERDAEIVAMLVSDTPVTDIAENLEILPATVNQALRRIMGRNDLPSRLALIRAYESRPHQILSGAELRMKIHQGRRG